MKTSRIFYVVLAIQSAILGYIVIGATQPTAVAQVPDQGAQLQQLIEETKALNGKMDRVVAVLEGGKLQVTMADKK